MCNGPFFATFLQGLAGFVSRYGRLSNRWALRAAVLGLLAIGVAAGWAMAPSVSEQADLLMERVPQSLEKLEERISRYGWGRTLLTEVPEPDVLMPEPGDVLSKATGIVSASLGVIANTLIVLMLGIYLARPGRPSRCLRSREVECPWRL